MNDKEDVHCVGLAWLGSSTGRTQPIASASPSPAAAAAHGWVVQQKRRKALRLASCVLCRLILGAQLRKLGPFGCHLLLDGGVGLVFGRKLVCSQLGPALTVLCFHLFQIRLQ
jgi:hypothetical protein